jgi:hypothetical protein
MGIRNPHSVKVDLVDALARRGSPLEDGRIESVLAEVYGCRSWQDLLDRWWSGSLPADDLQLSVGYIAARRSRQMDLLTAEGVPYAVALESLYDVHPASAVAPEDVPFDMVATVRFLVRDGMCVQLLERAGGWIVRSGFGHLDGVGELVVDAVDLEDKACDTKEEAALAAQALLQQRVAHLKERFYEKRSFFRFVPGRLFETPFGAMDTAELISSGIVRAFTSGSTEYGCYVLSPEYAAQLPAFAIVERGGGRVFMDADGMGLIMPFVFPKEFSEEERHRAGRVLADEYPLTYAVVAGGLLDRSNFGAVVMEWNDEVENSDIPEYMVVERVSSGKRTLVMAVRTDDVLKGLEVVDGHLFLMSNKDFEKNCGIDPTKHELIKMERMAIKLLRPH